VDLNNPTLKYWKDGDTDCWGVTDAYKQALAIDIMPNAKIFVETGTFRGDMVEAVRPYFSQVYSIELSTELHERNIERFKNRRNVYLYKGDSGEVLPRLLKRIPNIPTVFWLDAHPSGGDTANVGCPLERELTAILESRDEGVILIDDLQPFWGNDSPEVAERTIAKYPGWKHETHFGIMRVTR
jgi:hypothetical protein